MVEDIKCVRDLLDFASSWGSCPKKRKVLTLIFYGMLWLVWKARNDKVFNHKSTSPALVADNIKSLVFCVAEA